MRKIIKPQTLGLLFKPYQHRQCHKLVVSALVFFKYDNPDKPLAEHEQWPKVLPWMDPEQVVDECMPKIGAEILLAGQACTKGGIPETTAKVSLECLSVNKTIEVTGPRSWRYGLFPLQQIDDPQPFTKMPLTLAHAWGGQGCKTNTKGMGYTASSLPAFFKANTGQMPNMSFPDQKLKPGQAKHQPATFGPLPIDYPQRQKYAGTYGKKWLKHDFPGLADDIDWRFFNRAPSDQRLAEPFKGGESFTLTGFDPIFQKIKGHLPTLKPRAFIHTKQEHCEEVKLSADTVWFFPAENLGVMIFRGQHPIQDSDALDVDTILLAYEAHHQPRTQAYYENVLNLRLDPQTERAHAFNEAQLIPHIEISEEGEREAEAEAQALAAERLADFNKEHDIPPVPNHADKPVLDLKPKIPVTSKAQMAAGQIDLTPMLQAADKLVKEGEQKVKDMKAELDEKFKDLPEIVSKPISASQALEKADPKTRLAKSLAPFKDISHKEGGTKDLPKQFKLMDDLQQDSHRHVQQAPEYKLSEEAQIRLQSMVKQHLIAKQSLCGFDLGGIVLDHVDFTGCDLGSVNFTGARLSNCLFVEAKLTKSSFVGCHLDACDFSQANLNNTGWAEANVSHCQFVQSQLEDSAFSQTTFTDCIFTQTNLQQAFFQKAILTNVKFDQAELTGSQWISIQSNKCSWQESRGERISFLNSQLLAPDFRRCEWQRSALLNCQAMKADLNQVKWHKVLMTGALEKTLWSESTWRAAHLNECGFRSTDLQNSNFTEARLISCDLGNARMQNVTAHGTLFSKCLMMETQLQQAQLVKADLHTSLVRKADFTKANLHGVKCWGVDMSTSCLDHADLSDLWPRRVA